MSESILKLIDLSKWNGAVNFESVKKAGIGGVIIRTGFGVENPRQIDSRFEEYYKGAKLAGLYVGAYHYSYAKNAAGSAKEAEFMLKILKGKTFELPVYGDFEEQSDISKTECNNIITAFCSRLEAAGAWAGIYSYDTFFRDKLTADKSSRYTAWVARVENIFPKCVPAANVAVWQNSWKGRIGGVLGDVDLDFCYRDFPSLIKKTGRNIF